MRAGYLLVTPDGSRETESEQERLLLERGCEHIFREDVPNMRSRRALLRTAIERLGVESDSVLVVTGLDQLGTSVADAVRTVKLLVEGGIGLEVIEHDLDTRSESGELVAEVLLSLAEWERERHRQRTVEGMERARAAGDRPGPPAKLSEAQVEAVRTAVAGGENISSVARFFGVSRPTIYKALGM